MTRNSRLSTCCTSQHTFGGVQAGPTARTPWSSDASMRDVTNFRSRADSCAKGNEFRGADPAASAMSPSARSKFGAQHEGTNSLHPQSTRGGAASIHVASCGCKEPGSAEQLGSGQGRATPQPETLDKTRAHARGGATWATHQSPKMCRGVARPEWGACGSGKCRVDRVAGGT